MPDQSRDRFDRMPADLARVGAHRAPQRRGRGWVAFAWAALATGLLVAAGVVALTRIEGQVLAGGSPLAPAASAAATIDPKSPVVVLNGTATAGLAARAKATAAKAGWDVVSTANADSTSVATTTVYYARKGSAGAAAGLARSLGVQHTALSPQFAASGAGRLTVVLGKDYRAG